MSPAEGGPAGLPTDPSLPVILRLAAPELDRLAELITGRWPDREWATFARFGWHETPTALVVTLAAVDPPGAGDLDDAVDHVKIQAPYARRIALAAETHPLAVGIAHSHPVGAAPQPSVTDDDMDGYLAGYVADFAPDRPFVSLILAEVDGAPALSGRVHWRGAWRPVASVKAERRPDLACWPGGAPPAPPPIPPARVARLTSAFGVEAHQRLRRATVAVIGAGGTGSAAIPVLARAGVGRLVVVDDDVVSESNLERMHASTPQDVIDQVPKVVLARNHVAAIDPDCAVEAWIGRLPQPEIVEAVISADVLLGCTDSAASRLALADIARRYLVPAIDIGGLIEGADGRVTGQIVQLVRFLAADPCPLCRGMIDFARMDLELLSPAERERRREEAEARRAAARAAAVAAAGGLPGGAVAAEAVAEADPPSDPPSAPSPLPHEVPQIDTVGYITTTAGTLAAGYAIGWLTGRFDPPFERLQLNLVAEALDATDRRQRHRPDCPCATHRGHAAQAADAAPVVAPEHWEPARRV